MPAPWSVRFVGAVLLALAGALAGRLVQSPFRRRVEELQGWQLWLERLASEVAWQGRELSGAVAAAGRTAPPGVRMVTDRFLTLLSSARTTDELWAESVEGAPFLTAEDRTVLRELGPVLGRYSREEAAEHLAGCRARLLHLEQEARTARDGSGRALGSIVALSAVAAAVLVA
jgi:stage III sporulation protein AB